MHSPSKYRLKIQKIVKIRQILKILHEDSYDDFNNVFVGFVLSSTNVRFAENYSGYIEGYTDVSEDAASIFESSEDCENSKDFEDPKDSYDDF